MLNRTNQFLLMNRTKCEQLLLCSRDAIGENVPVWGRNKLERPQLFILLNLKNSRDVIGWDGPTWGRCKLSLPQTLGTSAHPTYISKLNII
jgi:hypothetical protein